MNVFIPKDKVSGERQGYGFVEFRTEEDANYSCLIMNMVRLYGKPIRVNKVRTMSIVVTVMMLTIDALHQK